MRIDNEREHRRLILQTLAGRTGLVTLSAGAATTTIVDGGIRCDSPVILVPATASAAAEMAGGTLHVDEGARPNGSVVITHAISPVADRMFRYFIG